ncbi:MULTISPECIES: hypothetical protein [Arthrobacter]|uniref:hypothetical protein n=1 Tax=Arthrobacter TaxID=1663 RepID=UPI001F2E19E5|nr:MULTISPECIES: hypothetical protein [Arthrobacter]
MSGTITAAEMYVDPGFGWCEINGGSAMMNGAAKLRIRLQLGIKPEADNQITGNSDTRISDGMAGIAPFRVKKMATKSKSGIARFALGGKRSHGTTRQARKRIPWKMAPVTNIEFWIRVGQCAGAATTKAAMVSVSGNSQNASRTRGVSLLKKRFATRNKGCSPKVVPFAEASRSNYCSTY